MDEGFIVRAILADDVAALQRALEHGVPIDRLRAFGLPPLLLAVSCGRIKLVSLLLTKGADVNGTTSGGITPLMLAVANVEAGKCDSRDSVKLVRILIDHGADPNRQNHQGRTALMLAAKNDQRAIVEILLRSGANSEARDRYGDSAKDYARRARNSVAECIARAGRSSTGRPSMRPPRSS